MLNRESPGFSRGECQLVCPVNTVAGVMGAGLAKSFATRWPDLVHHHRETCRSQALVVGRCILAPISRDSSRYAVLFPTKEHWKNPSQLDWIGSGMAHMITIVKRHHVAFSSPHDPPPSVALPALGCGLGGLDWRDVKVKLFYYMKTYDWIDWNLFLPRDPREEPTRGEIRP
jgi:O-acetyl-ADP-ribose deacetylase (regulator of RNase III)